MVTGVPVLPCGGSSLPSVVFRPHTRGGAVVWLSDRSSSMFSSSLGDVMETSRLRQYLCDVYDGRVARLLAGECDA